LAHGPVDAGHGRPLSGQQLSLRIALQAIVESVREPRRLCCRFIEEQRRFSGRLPPCRTA